MQVNVRERSRLGWNLYRPFCIQEQCKKRDFEIKSLVPGGKHEQQIGVALPNYVVEKFSDTFSRSLERRAANEANKTNICTPAALRDTLLPKLIFGEIRISDANVSGETRPW